MEKEDGPLFGYYCQGDVIIKIESRIKKLLLRNEFLSNLLKDAGIKVPNGYGTVKKRLRKWSHKVTSEQAKMLEKKALEKETVHVERPKPSTRQKISDKPKPKKFPLRLTGSDKKRKRKNPNPKCLIIFSQAAPVNNPFYVVTKNEKNKADTAITLNSVSRAPLVSANVCPSVFTGHPGLSNLGPGTLIFPNGSVVPINHTQFPQPTLIANPIQNNGSSTLIIVSQANSLERSSNRIASQPLISLNAKSVMTQLPIVTIPEIFANLNNGVLRSSVNFVHNQWPRIMPRGCSTNTTQVNKVPIPALTSKYNNYVYINKVKLPVANKKEIKTNDNNKGNQNKRKADGKTIPNVKKAKIDFAIGKSNKENNKIDEKEKSSSANEDASTTKEQTALENATKNVSNYEENIKNVQDVSVDTENKLQNSENQGKTIEKFEQTTLATDFDKNTIKQQQKCSDIVLNAHERNMDIKITETSNLTKSTSDILPLPKNSEISDSREDTCIPKQNQLDLNLAHSDLSNDIFASLHVPPGCQNPDSTSPTAAFLMAFPLVSSGIKVTEVMDGDNNDNSERETPNLLQIGSMDETKPSQSQTGSHSESLTPSLLNLENFSFFSHKDSYNQFGHTSSTPVFSSSMTTNIFSNVSTPSYASKMGLFDDLFYSQAISSLTSHGSHAPGSKSVSVQPLQSSAVYSDKNLISIGQNISNQTVSSNPTSINSTLSGSQFNSVYSHKNMVRNHTLSFTTSPSGFCTTKSITADSSLPATSQSNPVHSNKEKNCQIATSHSLSFLKPSSSLASGAKSISIGPSLQVPQTSSFSANKELISNTACFTTSVPPNSTPSTKIPSIYTFNTDPSTDRKPYSNKEVHVASEGINFPISIYGNTLLNTSDSKKPDYENVFHHNKTGNKVEVLNNVGSNSAATVELKNSTPTSGINFGNYLSQKNTTSSKETPDDSLPTQAKAINQDLKEQNQTIPSANDKKSKGMHHIKTQVNSASQQNLFAPNNKYLQNTNIPQKDPSQKKEIDEHSSVRKTNEILGTKVMSNFNIQTSLPAQLTTYNQNIFEQHRYTENNTKREFPFNSNGSTHNKPLDQNYENKKVNLHNSDHRALYNESCKNIFDFNPINTVSNKSYKLPIEQNVYNPNFFENNAHRDFYPVSTKNVHHLETNSNFNTYPLQLPPSTLSSTKIPQDPLINTSQKSVSMNMDQFNRYPDVNANHNLGTKTFNFNLYSSDTKKTNEPNLNFYSMSNDVKFKSASTLNQTQKLHDHTLASNFNSYVDRKNKNEGSLGFPTGSNNQKLKDCLPVNHNQHLGSQNFNFNPYSLPTKKKNEPTLYSQTAPSNDPKSKNDVGPNQNLISENFNFDPYSLDVKKKSVPNQNLQIQTPNTQKVKNDSAVNPNQNLDSESFNLNPYEVSTKKKHVVPNLYTQTESSGNIKSKIDSTINTNQNLAMQNYNFYPFSSDTKKKQDPNPSNLKFNKNNHFVPTNQNLPNFYPQIESSNHLKAKKNNNQNLVAQNFNFFPSYTLDTKKKNETNLERHQKQVYPNKSHEYSNYMNTKVSCTYAPPVSNFNPCYTNAGTYYYDYNSDNNYGNSYLKNPSNSGNNSYYFDYNACSETRKNDCAPSNNYCPSLDPYNRDKFASIITTKSKSATQQSKPVNWMTAPNNSVTSKDYLLPPFKDNNTLYTSSFPSSVVSSGYFNTVPTHTAGEPTNIANNKKNLDLTLPNYNASFQKGQAEENQFSWSPSKVPPFLDPSSSFVSATLPTLVGDLALNTQHHPDSKPIKDKSNKDNIRKVGDSYTNQNNQPNFLSVSQLVENKETTSAKVTSRRNSGSRTKNTSPQKVKRAAKADQNKIDKNSPGKASHSQVAEAFNNQKQQQVMKNFNKNVTSSYSAEALIGQPVQVESKRTKSMVPNFLTDNLVSYFPPVDPQMPQDGNSYIQQQQTYLNTSYPYTLANSFQNNSVTTSNIISNASTTYLPSSTFLNDQEFYPDIYNPTNKDKPCNKEGSKANLKLDKASNSNCKKVKKRNVNEGILPSFDIPFLSIPGAINSPILPDDFHHTFLPPSASYTCKNPLYPKQSAEIGTLLPPLPFVPGSKAGVQHPVVSPSINTAGTSLTNFNLSTIFPEINKGPPSGQVYPEKFKDQSVSQSFPVPSSGNVGKSTFTFSSYNT